MNVKDELEITKKSAFKNIISKNEKILFSATVTKINKLDKRQERNIVITTHFIYNLRSEGVLTSVTSLFNSNYLVKRKIDLKLIQAIVYAKLGNEFVLNIPTEFDYRFASERKDEMVKYILYALNSNGVREVKFYFTNELELHDFTTHNSQKKKGIVHPPRGDLLSMTIDKFEEYHKQKLEDQKQIDQVTTMFISSETGNKLTINNFNLLKTLGKGGFGKVYLVQKKGTKELFALKTIKKLFIIEKKQFEQVKREKEILYEAKHPFLVGLHAAFQTPDKLFFLMPFIQGGDLYAQLKKRKYFTEEEVRFFVAQIIEGLGFLHTKEIIYQDIKPENILLDKTGYVKLADFGAAKYVSQTKNYKTFVGTADYIAPEVLKKLPYTKSVDWWGLGILIFELLFSKTPFFNKNSKISFRMILTENPVFPESPAISDECKDFIRQLLNKDHLKRLGAAQEDNLEIRKHPWLSVIDFDKLLRFELPAPIVPVLADELDVENFNSKYTSERPKMTMLNEEIVKEMSKYDELFNGFSYNDIIQEHEEGEMDQPEDDHIPGSTPHNTATLTVEPQPVHKVSDAKSDDSSDSENAPHLEAVDPSQGSQTQIGEAQVTPEPKNEPAEDTNVPQPVLVSTTTDQNQN